MQGGVVHQPSFIQIQNAIGALGGAGVVRVLFVVGLTAYLVRMLRLVHESIGLITALVPYIGYERSSQVAKEALQTGRGVYDLVREKGWLTQERLDQILSPEAMTKPRTIG